MLIRTAYGEALRVQKDPGGPSRTKQSFKDECDINHIMAKYEKTRLIEHVNRFAGDYGDYLDVQDYHTSVNQVLAAQEAFNSLPARIRSRFGNDPAAFLDFIGDESNRDEAREMGLLKPLPTPSDASDALGDDGTSPPVNPSPAPPQAPQGGASNS